MADPVLSDESVDAEIDEAQKDNPKKPSPPEELFGLAKQKAVKNSPILADGQSVTFFSWPDVARAKSKVVISGQNLNRYNALRVWAKGKPYNPVSLHRAVSDSESIGFLMPDFNDFLDEGAEIILELLSSTFPGLNRQLSPRVFYSLKSEDSSEEEKSKEEKIAKNEKNDDGSSNKSTQYSGISPVQATEELLEGVRQSLLSSKDAQNQFAPKSALEPDFPKKQENLSEDLNSDDENPAVEGISQTTETGGGENSGTEAVLDALNVNPGLIENTEIREKIISALQAGEVQNLDEESAEVLSRIINSTQVSSGITEQSDDVSIKTESEVGGASTLQGTEISARTQTTQTANAGGSVSSKVASENISVQEPRLEANLKSTQTEASGSITAEVKTGQEQSLSQNQETKADISAEASLDIGANNVSETNKSKPDLNENADVKINQNLQNETAADLPKDLTGQEKKQDQPKQAQVKKPSGDLKEPKGDFKEAKPQKPSEKKASEVQEDVKPQVPEEYKKMLGSLDGKTPLGALPAREEKKSESIKGKSSEKKQERKKGQNSGAPLGLVPKDFSKAEAAAKEKSLSSGLPSGFKTPPQNVEGLKNVGKDTETSPQGDENKQPSLAENMPEKSEQAGQPGPENVNEREKDAEDADENLETEEPDTPLPLQQVENKKKQEKKKSLESAEADKAFGVAASAAWRQIALVWLPGMFFGSMPTIVGPIFVLVMGALAGDVYWWFLHSRNSDRWPLKTWQKGLTVGINLLLAVFVVGILLFFVTTLKYLCSDSKGLGALYLAGYQDVCKGIDQVTGTSFLDFQKNPYAGTTDGGVTSSGICQPVSFGVASVQNLQNSCFGSNAAKASSIAKLESGGQATNESKSDICKDGKAFSIGLFQINLTVHKINSLNCPAAFAGRDFACTVVNGQLYSQCVQAAKDAQINIQKACEISQNGQNWGAWSTNRVCKY